MSKAIYDAAGVLIPAGQISTSQSFPALPVEVRLLATMAWAVNVTVPPVASSTLVLEAASVEAGPYVELSRLAWPAGLTGSQQIELGVAASLSRAVSATHRWLRVSVTTTGALTMSSWLTKPSGSPGLATKPNSILTGI